MEIIRRNLAFGFRYGLAVGWGAVSADITYLLLSLTGALVVINHPAFLRIIGVCGSIVLLWFGWQAIRTKVNYQNVTRKLATRKKCFIIGYSMGFFNPYSVLFWLSLTSQIATISQHYSNAIYFMSVGVFLGVLSWQTALNLVVHFTRHRISESMMHWMNIIGGVILWGFAIYGLVHSIMI